MLGHPISQLVVALFQPKISQSFKISNEHPECCFLLLVSSVCQVWELWVNRINVLRSIKFYIWILSHGFDIQYLMRDSHLYQFDTTAAVSREYDMYERNSSSLSYLAPLLTTTTVYKTRLISLLQHDAISTLFHKPPPRRIRILGR